MAGESVVSHKQTLALPAEAMHFSLTMLREKLVKIGANVVRLGRHFLLQHHLAGLVDDTNCRLLHRNILDLLRFSGELFAHSRPAISNWTGLL